MEAKDETMSESFKCVFLLPRERLVLMVELEGQETMGPLEIRYILVKIKVFTLALNS